jgi:hypothetical protein
VRRLLTNSRIGLLAVVALAAVLAFEVVALTGDDDTGEGGGRPADRRLVSEFAEAIVSFDHRRIDADVARVTALGTPAFRREFDREGTAFTKRITDNKLVSVGRVVSGPRLQRVRGNLATFVVVVDQQSTAEGAPEDQAPNVDQFVLLVTIDRAASKVATVDQVWRS